MLQGHDCLSEIESDADELRNQSIARLYVVATCSYSVFCKGIALKGFQSLNLIDYSSDINLLDYPARIPDSHAVFRNRTGHYASGTYYAVFPNGNAGKQYGTATNPDIILNSYWF